MTSLQSSIFGAECRALSGALILVAGLSLSSCAHRHGATALERFEFTEPHMGVPFRIVLYAPDSIVAANAARAAFQRVKQLNDLLSDYDADSELSRLSRTSGQGRMIPVSPDLWIILERSQWLSAQTDGAFDVTVGPAVNLWRKARRERRLPRSDLLDQARMAMGHQNVRLNSRTRSAELLVPDMRLDLGAIAKGYAVDAALDVLATNGIHRALVAGAGDIGVSGPPPGKTGWRIEIAPMETTNAPPGRFVLLSHAALSTSGDVFQHLEIGGQRYSHILDPRTGIGLTNSRLVTVIAPDGITADSLDTAVSVLGPEEGLRLIKRMPRTDAYIVYRDGNAVRAVGSPGLARYFER